MAMKWDKVLGIGFLVVIASIIATFVFSLLKQTVAPLYASIPLTSGLTPTIGTKFLDLVKGTLGIDGTAVFTLVLSAFFILIVGGILFSLLKIKAKSEGAQIFWTMLLGTLVFYLLFVGLTLKGLSFNVLIGILIFYAVVTLITVWLAKAFKVKLDFL